MARRKRHRVATTWPVWSGSSTPPSGWPGWPEGREFGFVLTHDVEGVRGLDKCQRLMTLERSLGFRSCFNFVPEGDYRAPKELLEELVQSGFEVGVHDLYHDGKLYRSREHFLRASAHINRYLKEWNAVGFRAGFMRHNLDWQHALEVEYDCSTFDTDPFEPQPDGVGTIFPFWVPRPAGGPSHHRTHGPIVPSSSGQWSVVGGPSHSGYVELPYTLPQDSTLFLLLREQTPEVWLRKLDWVAQHGGMVLVNVHPDYVRFPGEPPSSRTYPVEWYTQLLEYVRDQYQGAFWHGLPRDVARYVRSLKTPALRRVHRRACVVAYTSYESDARVARYAKALAGRGDEVDVIALKALVGMPDKETLGGVSLHRIQTRGFKEKSRLSYLIPLLKFLFRASWWITRQHLARPYDVLHIHNVPDFHVFAAWYPKLCGARVILDIHDIVPEFFGSKFGVPDRAILIRLLRVMERASAAFSDHVIIANHLWLKKYTERSAPPEKCSVVINYVDRSIFHPRPRSRHDDRLLMVFPGGLQWHQGLDIAIQAFNLLKDRLPNLDFHIYGEGNVKPQLQQLVSELGLTGRVRFFDALPIHQIADIMANADLGVVPKRADSFGNEAYSTKIMEFMSLGVPVVVSGTRIDKYYFDDRVVRFFESGNPHAMAEGIYELLSDEALRKGLVSRALTYAEANNWESRCGDYLALVDALCDGTPPALIPDPVRSPQTAGLIAPTHAA